MNIKLFKHQIEQIVSHAQAIEKTHVMAVVAGRICFYSARSYDAYQLEKHHRFYIKVQPKEPRRVIIGKLKESGCISESERQKRRSASQVFILSVLQEHGGMEYRNLLRLCKDRVGNCTRSRIIRDMKKIGAIEEEGNWCRITEEGRKLLQTWS